MKCYICGTPAQSGLCGKCKWRDRAEIAIYLVGCVALLSAAFLVAMIGPNMFMGG